eukprot:6335827-Pyramimonas_sp.AAC.1
MPARHRLTGSTVQYRTGQDRKRYVDTDRTVAHSKRHREKPSAVDYLLAKPLNNANALGLLDTLPTLKVPTPHRHLLLSTAAVDYLAALGFPLEGKMVRSLQLP